MAFPGGIKVPELPPQRVPEVVQPTGSREPQPEVDSVWAKYQPGTAKPIGSRSHSRSRHARDYDDRGRQGRRDGRDASRPRMLHIPCHLEDAVREMLPDQHSGKYCAESGTFDGLYVDCTFGRGGHSRHILRRLSGAGRLIAFDVDPEAVQVAKQLEREDPRFRIAHRPFSELREELGDLKIDGLLVDLGVSSPQLDDRHRGFGVNEDSDLDLRMNQQVGIPAWQWLQECTKEEFAWVIREYGEDGDPIMADRIAEIVMDLLAKRRRAGRPPLKTTRELGDYVKIAKQNYDERGQHPAKLTFQAIRMFLNQEMQQMDTLLEAACETLVDKGRCVVITFKKKECDAVVKFVRQNEEPSMGRSDSTSKARWVELYPLMGKDSTWSVSFARSPIRPREEDIKENPRTRSAVVHVLKKAVRIQQKVTLDDGEPRTLEERYKKPDFVPVFKGSESPHRRETWDKEGWLPRFQEATGCPKAPAVFPPSESQTPQPQVTPEVKTPASFPPTKASVNKQAHPSRPVEGKVMKVKEAWRGPGGGYLNVTEGEMLKVMYVGQGGEEENWIFAKSLAEEVKAAGWISMEILETLDESDATSSPVPSDGLQNGTKAQMPMPASFPTTQASRKTPVAKAFPGPPPAQDGQASPEPSAFPAAEKPAKQVFPPLQPEVAETQPPRYKAFPAATAPSQANPQSPTQKIRFSDGQEKPIEAVAKGEGRARVDIDKLNARKGDLLWILDRKDKFLYGTLAKGDDTKLAWFPEAHVNVFVDL